MPGAHMRDWRSAVGFGQAGSGGPRLRGVGSAAPAASSDAPGTNCACANAGSATTGGAEASVSWKAARPLQMGQLVAGAPGRLGLTPSTLLPHITAASGPNSAS